MTETATTKETAGLLDDLFRRVTVFEMTANGKATDAELHRRSQAQILTLLAQVEELRRERDEARLVVSKANNSAFGSEAYFTNGKNGMSLWQAIEDLKDRATGAETKIAEMVRAEREACAKIAANVAKPGLGYATLYGNAIAKEIRARDTLERDEIGRSLRDEVTARLDAEARATKDEAGIAEAVKALEPFKRIADMEEHAEDSASVIINVNLCRAARAFVEKHKESAA